MIFEVVLFKLREGITEADFMSFNGKINQWLDTSPGYVARDLTKDENGQWVDIVRWESMEQAVAAAEHQPMMEEIAKYIDPESINMMHLKSVPN